MTDERGLRLDQIHDRDVAGRADLQRADFRLLSGRARLDPVLPRLAPAAARPGGADLDAGNTLMPFCIWVGFGDYPTLRVLAGGALVMGAVVADIIGDMRSQRQSS